MAYEPGGGSGEPYSRYEDLNFQPGYSIQDWLRNLMQQGNVGVAQPMGTNMPDFAQDQMYGRTPPSDLDLQPYQGMPEEELPPADGPRGMDPQEFIRQQLAGDVVPMNKNTPVRDDLETYRRLMQPGVMRGSQGMQSINQAGGAQSPYLDLMNILMMNRY